MRTADDHDTVGGLCRDRFCPICDHIVHAGYCADDVDGVRCPCHCPVPGAVRGT